jgi:hypothetical protein
MVAEYSIENEGIETSVDIVLCGVDPKRVTKNPPTSGAS